MLFPGSLKEVALVGFPSSRLIGPLIYQHSMEGLRPKGAWDKGFQARMSEYPLPARLSKGKLKLSILFWLGARIIPVPFRSLSPHKITYFFPKSVISGIRENRFQYWDIPRLVQKVRYPSGARLVASITMLISRCSVQVPPS